MIIVSQDKTSIVNFDNITTIGLGKEERNEILADVYRCTHTLGVYKTEEKAKEVLQEILGRYLECNSSIGSSGYVKNKIYQMPQE